MELNFIVPVPENEPARVGDEFINGRSWRVTAPIDTQRARGFKFHCVSYVWGPGTSPIGSLFNCQIQISDQTRPALEAAIKAAETALEKWGGERVEAFWIDAICIPQAESPARYKTLESMGFIYSLASSVLIVLKESAWKVISGASAKMNPGALSYADMCILENDKWISRVWTYQELVNAEQTYFTTPIKDPNAPVPVVKAEPFFNCVGYSLQAWKIDTESTAVACLQAFPNLNTLESTLGDWKMAAYLDRSALGVLSCISMRSYDPNFPQNRLLACLGALTMEESWGPSSTTLAELAEKFMRICESKADFSFIYTSDERSAVPGFHWRPAPEQEGGANLRPIVSWDISGSQTGHRDAQGRRSWLENMIRIYPSSGDRVSGEGVRFIKDFLYGVSTPGRETSGFYKRGDDGGDLLDAVLDCLVLIGFRGYPVPTISEHGLFFGQLDSYGKRAEWYVSGDMQWVFGRPGLCRWFADEGEDDKEDAEWTYCAGVYVGLVPRNQRGSKLVLA